VRLATQLCDYGTKFLRLTYTVRKIRRLVIVICELLIRRSTVRIRGVGQWIAETDVGAEITWPQKTSQRELRTVTVVPTVTSHA